MADPIDRDVNVVFGASLTGLLTGVQKAADAVKAGTDKMNSHLETVGKASAAVVKAFGAIAAVAAGGKFFAAAISEAAALSREVGQLSRQFGVTAEMASGMRVALHEAGMSTEDLQGITQIMTRQLRMNEAAMNAQGVVTRDAANHFLDQRTILLNSIEALKGFKTGTDQAIAAQYILGRGATPQTVEQLIKFAKASGDAEQKAKDFGVSVTADAVASAKEYNLALKDSTLALDGVENTIGQAVMPAFTDLLKIFNQLWQDVLPSVQIGFKALGTVLLTLVYGVQVIYASFVALITTLREVISTILELEGSSMSDWGGIMAAGADRIKDRWAAAFKTVQDGAKQTADQMKTMWDPQADQKAKPISTGTKTASTFDKTAASKELELIKEHYRLAQQSFGDYASMSASAEVDFWAKYLNTFKGGTKEALAVDIEYYKARREVASNNVENLRSSYEGEVEAARTDNEQKLVLANRWLLEMQLLYGKDSREYRSALKDKEAAERANIDQLRSFEAQRIQLSLELADRDRDVQDKILAYRVETGEVTAIEAAQINVRTVTDKYNSELAANAALAALYADDLEKRHEYADKAVQLESQKNEAIVEAGLEVRRAERDDMTRTYGSVVDSFGTALDGLLAKTMTWRQAMQSIVQSLQTSFIKMGIERVKNWLFSEEMMTSYSQMFAALRTALGWTSAGETVAAKSAEADVVVTENAGEAASGAAASMASIPYIGPILAIAAAAAMLALVLGFKSGGGGGSSTAGTPSAAKGWWEVPNDTLALIHKKEMVMPANLAEPLRDKIEGDGSFGGGGDIHAHFHLIDGNGVRDLMKNHGDTIFGGLKSRLKDNKR